MKKIRISMLTAAALAGLSSLTVVITPVHAVHQCGAVEHGNNHSISNNKASPGCKKLRETDFFNGDPRADAPDLANRGDHAVGVRTMEIINPDEVDILNWTAANPDPRYDRPLKMEIWYPALLEDEERQITTYKDVLGSGPDIAERPLLPFEFGGRAARGAMPKLDGGPYPLLIVSHGYPGSRVLLTYLTENLASKGYIVVAIDHTDSTHADATGFASTLLNRTLDINFVLESMAIESDSGNGFLKGMVNADNTAVIGYSMGGYGALNAAGAGYSEYGVTAWWGVPGDHLRRLQAGTEAYANELDSRIRAIVAFAPWGGNAGFWDAGGMEGLQVPSLFISGKQDQTAGYESIKWLYESAVNSDRYLLAYESAIHEVAANPAPPLAEQHYREYVHYQEPGWDNRRLNNVNQHFITAFLGKYLGGDIDQYEPYLDRSLSPISNDSERTNKDDPTYWKGFPNWSAIGMELHHLLPL